MSDTPRVDSYVYKFPGCQREPRLIDFARQLERKIAAARAEIERLKCRLEDESMRADGMTTAHAEADARNYRLQELIEQMREALVAADGLIDEYAADYEHRDNVDEIRDGIKAALSAAERMSK